MQLTFTEENYLKAIYTIEQRSASSEVAVNEIAEQMSTKPATVTDMLRKLSEKELIHYEKYKKMRLSGKGLAVALQIVRKHRLWETFLHEKLNFTWDEVHEVAEQMEHIHSQKLIDKLDEYLGYPRFDPHGDPIPNEHGELPEAQARPLVETDLDVPYVVIAVKDASRAFLQQLERFNLQIGTTVVSIERMPYDNSTLVKINDAAPVLLSEKISSNILVQRM